MGDTKTEGLFHSCPLTYYTYLTQYDLYRGLRLQFLVLLMMGAVTPETCRVTSQWNKSDSILLHLVGLLFNVNYYARNHELKFIDAKQEKEIYHYKNTKRKLYRTNAAIWYNKTCLQYFTVWPVPEAAVTVFSTPDDGCCGHPKHVKWLCSKINQTAYCCI